MYANDQFTPYYFWFNPFWLAASYYANLFFLMEMSFLNLSLFYLRPLFEERNWSVKQWFTVYQIKEYS
jgi:hypothetical protein